MLGYSGLLRGTVVQQPSCGNPNTLRTMHMTSSKYVLQQRHLLGYESKPDP